MTAAEMKLSRDAAVALAAGGGATFSFRILKPLALMDESFHN